MIAKAKVPADKELAFCDDKIQKNFSNYSSWHYRSQLLPTLYPHENDSSRPISEAKLKEELELVITAAFTDPNDSSAWFYQRWLLGYSDPKLDLAAIKISNSQAILSFTKPVDLVKDGIKIDVKSVAEVNTANWCSLAGGKSDSIWIQQGDFQLVGDKIEVVAEMNGKSYHVEAERTSDGSFIGVKMPTFGYEFGAAVIDELKNQLDSCNQLLEYEPDSKWTLLTAALLMRSIDRFHYHEKTLEFLKKLESVDRLRAGYYKDLASKWAIEVKLKSWIDRKDFGSADLSKLGLTTLYYHQYFAVASRVELLGNPKLKMNTCKLSWIKGCEVAM